ncbi:MAG: KTSC domain-containing protein [Chitinophagaceae bacterium]|nr:KTSC domain-containing protein [Chitinophagaceae bacterium]
MPSQVISTFHYDEQKKALTVVFRTGRIYIYKDVPEQVYQQMKESFSKGTFLNQVIKGQFKFEKLA